MKKLILAFAVFSLPFIAKSQAPVANFVADDSTICIGYTVMFTDLSTNSPTAWSWSFPGGNPTSSTSQNPAVQYNSQGVYSVVLIAYNSNGNDTIIKVNYIDVAPPPTTANAGPSQSLCTTNSTLAANSPTTGTGTWTVFSGSATFANPNSPTTNVSNLGIGVNVLQWTIDNPPCVPSIDTMSITVYALPTAANAGPDQSFCASQTSTTMAGNTPTVGTGTWTLVLGAGTITNPNSPTTTVTGLGIGTNTFQWTITNGVCPPSTDQVTITVNATPGVSVTPPSASICSGNSINLTASGANTYSWSPASGLSNTTAASVLASPTVTTTYMVTGTGSNGCTSNDTVVVTVTPIPTVNVSPGTTTVCDNAPLTVIAFGATTYSWSPATGLSATTGSTVVALPSTATTYTVTGTTNGCSNNAVFTLTPIPAPTASVTPTSGLICAGNTINLTGSGGSTYTWYPATGLSSTTGASVVASPTTTTAYNVIAVAPNGCGDTASAIIAVNQPPNVIITPSSPTICSNAPVTLTASGASTYNWAPSTGLNTTTGSTVIALPSVTTTYTVTGTVVACGTATNSFIITVIPAPTVTVTPNSTSICSGSFTNLIANGASTYTWSPASGLSSTTGTVVTANPTASTTYTVVGIAANGCSDTVAVPVTVNPLFALNTSSTPSVCGNINSGTATVTNTGGTPPFTYQWNDPLMQTNDTAFFLAPGTYFVTVTDANGCSVTTSSTVLSTGTMSLSIAYSDALCFGTASGTATLSVTGGSPPYTYLWSDPQAQTTAMADSLMAGTYTVTVTDTNNCAQSIAVTIAQPTALTMSATGTFESCNNNNGTASTGPINGGVPPYTFAWSNGANTQGITGLDSGMYTVTLTDANGCTRMDTVVIGNSMSTNCMFIPNAFSPNGDGDHDLFVIDNIGVYPSVKVAIFNRWGNLVYENPEYKNDWDGTNGGDQLPGGVYYFVITPNGGDEVSGTLTLIR
ncbi:MAG: gliding motility-associated C-terminal domain-containing protein [Bacteroidota bacterium]